MYAGNSKCSFDDVGGESEHQDNNRRDDEDDQNFDS